MGNFSTKPQQTPAIIPVHNTVPQHLNNLHLQKFNNCIIQKCKYNPIFQLDYKFQISKAKDINEKRKLIDEALTYMKTDDQLSKTQCQVTHCSDEIEHMMLELMLIYKNKIIKKYMKIFIEYGVTYETFLAYKEEFLRSLE